MSEKPIVNLLVRIKADFKEATTQLNKLGKKLDDVSGKVKELGQLRMTVRIDMKGLLKDTAKIESNVKGIKDIMSKALSGTATKADRARLNRYMNQIVVMDRFKDQSIRKKQEEIELTASAYKHEKFLKEQVAGVVAEHTKKKKAIEAQNAALEKEVTNIGEMQKKTKELRGAIKAPTRKAKELAKAFAASKGSVNDIVKRGLPASEMEQMAKAAKDYAYRIGNVEANTDSLYRLADNILDNKNQYLKATGQELARNKEMIKAATEYQSSLKGANKQKIDSLKIAEKLIAAAKKTHKEAAKPPGGGPDKAAPRGAPPSLSDLLKSARVQKQPIMGVIQKKMPEVYKDINWVATRLTETHKDYGKAVDHIATGTQNIVHQFGIASTYVGQFDKRMRYLSRDIYIMGLYSQQLAQSWKAQFQTIVKSSVDLEGAIEDVGYAWEELMEPVGDVLAPVFDNFAETIEGLADIFEDLGMPGIIAGFVMLGGVFARILAPALRFISVLNLFLKSSVPMLRQQRELAAAQDEYAKTTQNIGMQYGLLIVRFDEMVKKGADVKQTLDWINTGMKEQEGLLRSVRENLVRAGGDPSRMLENFGVGLEFILQRLEKGHIAMDVLTGDQEGLMKEFAKYSLKESPLWDWKENMAQKGFWGGAKQTFGDFMTILRLKSRATFKSPEFLLMEEAPERLSEALGITTEAAEEMLAPFQEHLAELKKMAGAQDDVTKKTSRGTTTGWKMVGMLGTLTVGSAILTQSMESLTPLMDVFADIAQSMLEPLEPMIDAIAELAEGFGDWFEKLTDAEKIGTLLVGLFAGKAILTLLGGAATAIGSAIVTGIGTFLVTAGASGIGTAFMAALHAIPVIGWILLLIGAIKLLWTAWKNNWWNIRDIVKNIIDKITGWLKPFTDVLKGVGDYLDNIWNKGKTVGIITGAEGVGLGMTPEDGVFQSGGYVKRTGLGMLHAGETVMPAGRDLSRTSTVNHIQVDVFIDKSISESIDEYTIGRVVSEQIAQQLRRKM